MGYLFQIFPDDIDYKLRLLLDIFTLLGIIRVAIWLITILLAVIIGLRVHVISRYFPVNLRSKYGPWALVTGATDGVGLEYCREFAAKGLNLIILGRSQEKLDRVKEELSNGHADIEVVTVQVDLNSDDEQLYHRIEGQIRPGERDIGVVVNNAGVMYDSPNKFLDQQESSIWQQVFVEWFSESLNIEYAQDGIDVQTLIPNYIATKMTKWSDLLQKPSLSYPSAAAFTHNAVATI
ncbi:PREDICTED: inactive hydroxysteroid dehydrogenase-like protein 1, partial [Rhagoletis zephyria]|uniref:inactive hydroxysteroid dehydrogenase-like protein 1 n=1 Tax=Rhagoletis zephyria TaxID=28612 RepID=UPI0008112B23